MVLEALADVKTHPTPLSLAVVPEPAIAEGEVRLRVTRCGVCHTELDEIEGRTPPARLPVILGHQVVGTLESDGLPLMAGQALRLQKGQRVGVAWIASACGHCDYCKEGLEQYCEEGNTGTYNSPDKHLGTHTFGGYSESIVVNEAFVLRVPENLDLAATAPLLCAGITTYSPLRHWNVGPGKKVGIVGIGGLGHMGVKLAKAMGAEVIVFTTSPSKVEDAKRLGADEVVLSKDEDQMSRYAGKLHFVLDAVSAKHDINAYLNLLRVDGSLALVGAPELPLPVAAFSLIPYRRSFAGSLIGGIAETQEMLDFCGKHNIVSDIEMINIQQINEAYERLLKGDVKYRFVIDMASLKK